MTRSPSVSAKTDASSPSMKASTTTLRPASPNFFSVMMPSSAFMASSTVRQTSAPLPAASPSALTTIGAPSSFTYARAFATSEKTSKAAVGIPSSRIIRLENTLLHSISAAARVGPKALMPRLSTASTTPASSAPSGPTTTRSTPLSRAKSAIPRASSCAMDTHSPRAAIPGLPGAAYRVSTWAERRSAQASVCSLPPLPTTRTFMESPDYVTAITRS